MLVTEAENRASSFQLKRKLKILVNLNYRLCYHNKLIFTLDKPGYFFIAKNVQKFVVFIELLYPKSKFVLTNRKNKIQTYFVFLLYVILRLHLEKNLHWYSRLCLEREFYNCTQKKFSSSFCHFFNWAGS